MEGSVEPPNPFVSKQSAISIKILRQIISRTEARVNPQADSRKKNTWKKKRTRVTDRMDPHQRRGAAAGRRTTAALLCSTRGMDGDRRWRRTREESESTASGRGISSIFFFLGTNYAGIWDTFPNFFILSFLYFHSTNMFFNRIYN